MEEFSSLDVVFIREVCPKCIFSFGNCNGYEELVTGLRVFKILPVIIHVIDKSESRLAAVRFC